MKKNSIFLLVFVLAACNDYSPKPNAYPRVEFPNQTYILAQPDCAFEMLIPSYSVLHKSHQNQDCWFNLNYLPFDATLHLSYKPLYTKQSLDSMMEDAYQLAFKHISRAEEIIEKEFSDSNGNYGMIYDLQGKTATPFNFYLTDKDKHFIRGSFYFNKKTNRDSVAPIYQFIKRDMMLSIKSIKWKD